VRFPKSNGLNQKKGISSIVGGIFFLVLMTSGFTVYYVALDSQAQMLDTQQVIADYEVAKIREKFTISASTDPNDILEISVTNQGNNLVEIADVWIINKTAANQPAIKSEIKYNDAFIPAGYSGDILENTPLYMSPGEYDIKVVSTLGTIVTEVEFDPNNPGGEGFGVFTGAILMNFTSFQFCQPVGATPDQDCTSDSSDWETAWVGKKLTQYIWRITLANRGAEDLFIEQHTALFMLRAQTQGGGNLPRVFYMLNDTTTTNEGPIAYTDHSKIMPTNNVPIILYFGATAWGGATLETSHDDTASIAINVLTFGHRDTNGNMVYDVGPDLPYSQNMAFQAIRLE